MKKKLCSLCIIIFHVVLKLVVFTLFVLSTFISRAQFNCYHWVAFNDTEHF